MENKTHQRTATFALKKTSMNLESKRLRNTGLSHPFLAVLLGSLLGDGSLKKYGQSKNARLTIKHTLKSKPYLEWKTEVLSEILTKKVVVTTTSIAKPFQTENGRIRIINSQNKAYIQ